jgi:hypothetical protein
VRYVNLIGDEMTGKLKVRGVTEGVFVENAGAASIGVLGTGPLAAATISLSSRNDTTTTGAVSQDVDVLTVSTTGSEVILKTAAGGVVSSYIDDKLVMQVLDDGVTFYKTQNTFLQASVNGDATRDRPLVFVQWSRGIGTGDASRSLVNNSTGATDVVLTIPANASDGFAIGTIFNVYDLSPTASTVIQAAPGVSLVWNASIEGKLPAVAGGVAAGLRLAGPIGRIMLLKSGTNTWHAFT